MKQTVKLIFGIKRNIHASIAVSPETMLILLRYPLRDWMRTNALWDEHSSKLCVGRSDIEEEIYDSLSVLDPEDDYSHIDFEWRGFRVDLESDDNHVEFVFCDDHITGEVHLNYAQIVGDFHIKVREARELLNSIDPYNR